MTDLGLAVVLFVGLIALPGLSWTGTPQLVIGGIWVADCILTIGLIVGRFHIPVPLNMRKRPSGSRCRSYRSAFWLASCETVAGKRKRNVRRNRQVTLEGAMAGLRPKYETFDNRVQ